jgi:hypothetical protein
MSTSKAVGRAQEDVVKRRSDVDRTWGSWFERMLDGSESSVEGIEGRGG